MKAVLRMYLISLISIIGAEGSEFEYEEITFSLSGNNY